MKKNRALRLASVLMMACLLTTCVISGTFAKYVSTATGTDSARVAKWGVTVTASGTTFAKEYAKDDRSASSITNSVVSSGNDKLVAPGTKGTMAVITLAGTPEVAVKVSYQANLELAGWTIEHDGNSDVYYCPIVITVGETVIAGTSCTDMADFEAKVEAEINKYTAEYAANTNMNTVTAPTVSWKWEFTGDDVKDTKLGDAATPATISLTIITTITQID